MNPSCHGDSPVRRLSGPCRLEQRCRSTGPGFSRMLSPPPHSVRSRVFLVSKITVSIHRAVQCAWILDHSYEVGIITIPLSLSMGRGRRETLNTELGLSPRCSGPKPLPSAAPLPRALPLSDPHVERRRL